MMRQSCDFFFFIATVCVVMYGSQTRMSKQTAGISQGAETRGADMVHNHTDQAYIVVSFNRDRHTHTHSLECVLILLKPAGSGFTQLGTQQKTTRG